MASGATFILGQFAAFQVVPVNPAGGTVIRRINPRGAPSRLVFPGASRAGSYMPNH